MTSPFVHSIRDLTTSDILKLTYVLSATDPSTTSSLISDLPFPLKRNRFLPNVLTPAHPAAPSCPLHKPLNNRVIRSIFNQFAHEVGYHINIFISNSHRLTSEQRARMNSLRELNSTWMTPTKYSETFHIQPLQIWHQQPDGCEACILTRACSDPYILTNLRTVLLTRTRTRRSKPPPSLLRFVEQWVKTLDEETRTAICFTSGEASIELKALRKRFRRERDGRSTTTTTSTSASIPPREEEEIDEYDDFENDIIDHYAALISTPHLPTFPTPPDTEEAQAVLDRLVSVPRRPVASSIYPEDTIHRHRPPVASSIYPEDTIPMPPPISEPEHIRDRLTRWSDFMHTSASAANKPNEDEEVPAVPVGEYIPARSGPAWQKKEKKDEKKKRPGLTVGGTVDPEVAAARADSYRALFGEAPPT